MRRAILLYLAGITAALVNPTPPAPLLSAGLAALAAVLCARRASRGLALAALGLAWGSVHTASFLAARPAVDDPAVAVQISGAVASFAQLRDGAWSFELVPAVTTTTARIARLRYAVQGLAGARPAPGAWCVIHARLRRPHGLANFGARERERGLTARRIGALARVVQHPGNVCVDIAPSQGLAAWRARLAGRIDAAVAEPGSAAVLRALTVADRSALTEAQWNLVRATGTAHLLAISGLHVALAAALCFALCRYAAASIGWRRQAYPAIRCAWFGAAAGAVVYAALAGFGVPATRAACMVLAGAVAALRGRRVLSWDCVLGALAAIATLDPFALLGESLWLSFTAVAILVALAQLCPSTGSALRQAWRMHLALALGMAPLTGAVFGAVPLMAPLANLVAVPWCSVLIVPLTLAAALISLVAAPPAAILWDMAARLWQWLAWLLERLAAPGWELPTVALAGEGGLAPLACALALLALPAGLHLRRLAVLLLFSLCLTRPPPPPSGSFAATVLDVGQGLAVVVRTARHTLLYDAGPRWWSGTDAGTLVVVPALRRMGIARLDTLVISHADSDHVGGLGAVAAAFEIATWRAPVDADLVLEATPLVCDRAAAWRWDGVIFRLLAVPARVGASRNDRSCVVLIESAAGRLLLTGDIERAAEQGLVASYGAGLRADVMVVPHHGSATSSSAAFLAAVAPRYAVVPVGYANRYRMPHAEVVARYHAAGVTLLDTAKDGAVSIAWRGGTAVVRTERERRIGFWTTPRRD